MAFTENYALAPTAYNAVDAVPDGVFSAASATGLYVPAGMMLVAAYCLNGSAWINPRVRINAASLLKIGYPSVVPIESSAGANDPNFQVLLDRPIVFPNNEVVGVDIVADSGPTGRPYIVLLLPKRSSPFRPATLSGSAPPP